MGAYPRGKLYPVILDEPDALDAGHNPHGRHSQVLLEHALLEFQQGRLVYLNQPTFRSIKVYDDEDDKGN